MAAANCFQQRLAHYGLETLIAIARFWDQRANLRLACNQFVMLGVTGPWKYPYLSHITHRLRTVQEFALPINAQGEKCLSIF
ncbi:MAG: hypothetical protein JNL51_16080 [Chitinophagaceae bacterium]|nr:hypothetical protein [Chitinophagaceae bacterium]